jgi:DNA invertase Pin-like site-specific DNA recombinase
MRIGYGRVSTRDQHPEAQHDALAAAGCEQIFIDKASGKLARCPQLDKALQSANRSGDQLVITKLDRLGRSLEHLIELSKLLQARGVDLVVLDQGIDTSTAVSRMFFQILGAIAEFEHALMSERTLEGSRPRAPAGEPVARSPSSARGRSSSPDRCTTRPTATANVSTPSPRSPPSSALALAGRRSTATWRRPSAQPLSVTLRSVVPHGPSHGWPTSPARWSAHEQGEISDGARERRPGAGRGGS